MAKRKKAAKKPAPPKGRNSTRESRASKKQYGTAAIETVKNLVDILKPYELSEKQRLRTYQNMLLDDAVSTPFYYSSILIEKAFSNYTIECDENDPESVVAAQFIKDTLETMKSQTVRRIARNAAEFKRDGISIMEKVFHKSSEGEWNGFWQLSKLAYIHPLTLSSTEPFVIDQGGDKITFIRQNVNSFKNSNGYNNTIFSSGTSTGTKDIPRKKCTLFTYSDTDSQPFGVSAFDAAYTAWREKVLLQDYTLIGVTKDFSGTPVLYLPSDILATASADPSSQEAIMVSQLKNAMANMHTGDQNYTILPSDTLNENGSGSKAFEIKFLGVEGGGKSFDSESLIEQRKRAIYNCFGATQLLSGENGGGSYNLHEGQANVHMHYIERDIAVIEEGFNKDIIPELFKLNEWVLTPKQMPRIKAGEIQPISLDEMSKALQRVGAVGLLPSKDADFLNEMYAKMGINYRFPEGTSAEEVEAKQGADVSRSGDGMVSGDSSGTGSAIGGGDSSVSNNENKA